MAEATQEMIALAREMFAKHKGWGNNAPFWDDLRKGLDSGVFDRESELRIALAAIQATTERAANLAVEWRNECKAGVADGDQSTAAYQVRGAAIMTSEDRKQLSEIGYQVIDAKNEHVEKGWIVRVPNDDERVLIAASEGDAWDAARDHHARMTSEVTQAALEPCPFCGGKAEWKDDPNICGVPFGLVVDHKPDCFLAMPMSEEAMLAAWNTRLTAQSGEGRSGAGEDAVAVGLAEQVAEAMDDDGGSWRSCTGCHETNEGYSTGHFPYSAALKCELGSGCRECGGIGAVWDDTDYADMADFIAAADRDHANIKRILIENDIQPYRAEQIAMAITELEIPAALNARQSGEGEREEHLAIVECSDPNDGWSLSIKFGSGNDARDRMRAFSDRLRAGEA